MLSANATVVICPSQEATFEEKREVNFAVESVNLLFLLVYYEQKIYFFIKTGINSKTLIKNT